MAPFLVGALAANRPLPEAEPPNAAPPIAGIDPLNDDGGKVLHLKGESALNPHDQRSRLSRHIGPAGTTRPLDLHRLTIGREPFADDLRPTHDNIGRGKALRCQHRRDAGIDQLGQRAGHAFEWLLIRFGIRHATR